jgi:hypothetical protein
MRARYGHLDDIALLETNSPKSSGTGVTEHSTRATSENRGHPAAIRTHRGTTDRVDTSMNWVQPPTRDSMPDSPWRVSESQQLPPSNDPVLPLD